MLSSPAVSVRWSRRPRRPLLGPSAPSRRPEPQPQPQRPCRCPLPAPAASAGAASRTVSRAEATVAVGLSQREARAGAGGGEPGSPLALHPRPPSRVSAARPPRSVPLSGLPAASAAGLPEPLLLLPFLPALPADPSERSFRERWGATASTPLPPQLRRSSLSPLCCSWASWVCHER